MDHRRMRNWVAVLGLGLAIGSTAEAGAITFTGNVGADFPQGQNNGVYVVPGLPAGSVGQASWITNQGWINGWTIKDLRFDYNKASNTMQVGVNFYSIAGAADGNPAGVPDPRTIAAGGSDPAHLGGQKSITVEFAPSSATNPSLVGTPLITAGVPQNKTSAGTGTDGFTVSSFQNNGSLPLNYGTPIPGANGNLAFDPSPAHPDFEFAIKDWSKFSSMAGATGFWISAYAGSPNDVVAGESNIGWIHVPLSAAQTVVPEPTAFAGWALMAGGAAWALRRSRKGPGRA